MRSSYNPKGILFDIFGVLLSSNFRSACAELATLLGRSVEQIEPVYVRWEYPWDRGRITEVEFWQAVQRELGTNTDWRDLNQAVLDSIHPLQGSLELLDLCAQHVDVYLLSDTRSEWFEVLDARFGLRRRVKRAFLSYEMGVGKAEPQCFEYVLSELNNRPSDIYFLDDRKENIDMARRFGLQAIHFTGAADAKSQILHLLDSSKHDNLRAAGVG